MAEQTVTVKDREIKRINRAGLDFSSSGNPQTLIAATGSAGESWYVSKFWISINVAGDSGDEFILEDEDGNELARIESSQLTKGNTVIDSPIDGEKASGDAGEPVAANKAIALRHVNSSGTNDSGPKCAVNIHVKRGPGATIANA